MELIDPQTIAPSLTLEVIRDSVLDMLLQLASDPIPNIRFNVAKALEIIATSVGDAPEGVQLVQQKIAPVLEIREYRNDLLQGFIMSIGSRNEGAVSFYFVFHP